MQQCQHWIISVIIEEITAWKHGVSKIPNFRICSLLFYNSSSYPRLTSSMTFFPSIYALRLLYGTYTNTHTKIANSKWTESFHIFMCKYFYAIIVIIMFRVNIQTHIFLFLFQFVSVCVCCSVLFCMDFNLVQLSVQNMFYFFALYSYSIPRDLYYASDGFFLLSVKWFVCLFLYTLIHIVRAFLCYSHVCEYIFSISHVTQKVP